MTREEAIARIQEHIVIHRIKEPRAIHITEALEMAIKALEQEPCEDAISRQAVKDMLMREWTRYIPMDLDVNLSFVLAKVGELPPVTPQPKMGRWIDDRCSVCGKGIEDLIDSYEWYRNEQPNFCPFCGARMVEPQESEGEE